MPSAACGSGYAFCSARWPGSTRRTGCAARPTARPLQIVHRDVSPSNVLVNLAGSGLIADFGIARAAAYRVSTLPGVLKGTPCYMAPEQASGSDDIDARADVFALGAVLWEVLTGEQLFYSPTGIGAVLERVLTDKIEAPSCRNSRLPTAIDAVCMKALQRATRRALPERGRAARRPRAASDANTT